MKRVIPIIILFWLAACIAALAASSCRRETPVAERPAPAETPRKAPGSPVATRTVPPVPSQSRPVVRSLAAIPAPLATTSKRRAVRPAQPAAATATGSVVWTWSWEPAGEGNPDLTGQPVVVTILIDRAVTRYGSTFVGKGDVKSQRYVVEIPRAETDGRWIAAVLTSGGYECGKGVPQRSLP